MPGFTLTVAVVVLVITLLLGLGLAGFRYQYRSQNPEVEPLNQWAWAAGIHGGLGVAGTLLLLTIVMGGASGALLWGFVLAVIALLAGLGMLLYRTFTEGETPVPNGVILTHGAVGLVTVILLLTASV